MPTLLAMFRFCHLISCKKKGSLLQGFRLGSVSCPAMNYGHLLEKVSGLKLVLRRIGGVSLYRFVADSLFWPRSKGLNIILQVKPGSAIWVGSCRRIWTEIINNLYPSACFWWASCVFDNPQWITLYKILYPNIFI